MEKEDLGFMKRAFALAAQGIGFVNPNPVVGAVVVKEGVVIGEGYHQRYGEWHAERNALAACSEDPAGATIYVTLEPCSHTGKTPPCVEAIIEQRLARVVIAMTDPNPLVAGRGIKMLEDAGIEVKVGVGEEYAKRQNRVFIKYITTRIPWVTIKSAITLDGKIATYTGDSRWVTGEESRKFVHRLRHEHSAIMVGIGTVLADDPMLNIRLEDFLHIKELSETSIDAEDRDSNVRQPIRIVVDSNARTPLDCRLVTTAKEYRSIIAHTRFAPKERLAELSDAGVELLLCKESKGMVDLADLIYRVGESGIDSILLEGGGNLNYSFLERGLVDELYTFIAPKIVGGATAKTSVEGEGIPLMKDAIWLSNMEVTKIGDDILIHGLCED